MAIVCLKVPYNIAKTLSGIDVPGDHVPTEEKHITILNLGDDLSIQTIGKSVITCARVTEKMKPFQVQLNGYSTFPKGKLGIPIICHVQSEELHELHDQLSKAFDSSGIEYSKKFPEFKPHVTLSYCDEKIHDKKFKNSFTWTATDLVLWGGEHGDERIFTVFDFLG
jgi:2'-5' RNA ligase